ncbi:hypothetical protein ACFL6C_03805 [Myxococcota bacterium]
MSSESVTPFVVDGRCYQSVLAFYSALKIPEDDPFREEVADATWSPWHFGKFTKRYRGTRFVYQSREIVVGATPHLQLVARATEAKARASRQVQRALLQTGDARLFMGAITPLGRAMPFALMAARYQLRKWGHIPG